MAKKKNAKKTANDVNLDELVNEGKSIDVAKVDEIIEENKDKVEEVKEETTEVVEETPSMNIAEEDKGTAEEEILMEEEIAEVEQPSEEVTASDDAEETVENIDDVIAECTGEAEKVEESVKEEKSKNDEPWYVARARRISDYYNW